MKARKKAKLLAAGWQVGSAEEFLKPKAKPPRKVRVTLYLEPELIAFLTAQAKAEGISRSALICRILTEYLDKHHKDT